MAKISALTLLGAAPADDDNFVILDVSDTTQSADGTTKGLAASRVARTGAANTFTALQTVAPSSGASGVTVNQSAAEASAAGINVANNNNIAIQFFAWNNLTQISASRRNLGNNVTGPQVYAGRNSNASTEGPAAGNLRMEGATGEGFIWRDTAGNLRIHTAAPTGSSGSPTVSDTAGTVVGTQTSWHETKENIEEWDGAEALAAIRAMTLYSYQMIADGQANSDGTKPTYKGIVITDEDRENNAWFGLGYGDQQIPALNDRNLFGYMLAAIRHGGDIINELQDQAAALTARVEALEAI